MAISYYTKAIKKDPNDTASYTNRGGDYENIGEHQKALDDFEKALELNPDCYEAYLIRNYTYHSLWKKEVDPEQRDEFIRLQLSDLERAIELNPENNEAQQLLKKLLDELEDKNLINRFEFYGTKEDARKIILATIDEKIGDLQKEEKDYTEAFKQYADAILPYIPRYICSKDIKAKDAIIRIISKIYALDEAITTENERNKLEEKFNEISKYIRALPALLYQDGNKDEAEKLLILLLHYDKNDKNSALNLAFMKRRNETKYVEHTAIELLDLCSDQKSGIWCMNRALCYIDGIDVDKNWHTAVNILNCSETDIDSAIEWWRQAQIVGEKEHNIAFLLFSLSSKYNVYIKDSYSIKDRIRIAKDDGYEIPDDLLHGENLLPM